MFIFILKEHNMASEQPTSQIEVVEQQPKPKKNKLVIIKKQDVSNSNMLELPTTQDFTLLDSELGHIKLNAYTRQFINKLIT